MFVSTEYVFKIISWRNITFFTCYFTLNNSTILRTN